MPTYAELNAEAVWRNETVTDEMREFGNQLCDALGVPRNHFGCKGDNARGHMKGGHRSQAWILGSRFCANRTYTVEPGLPASLANDVPAFDITPKTREQMIALSRNADRATRSGGLEELVVWYGTFDGKTVVGFDNIRNALATSDPSHTFHLHGQLKRWLTRNRAAYQRILAALLGKSIPAGGTPQPGGDDMSQLASEYVEAWAVGSPATPSGRAVEPVKWRIRDEAWQVQVNAQLAAMKATVEALAAAIRSGGGDVSTAAILAEMQRLAAADEQRDADQRTRIAALEQDIEEHREQLAAERARLAKALAGE